MHVLNVQINHIHGGEPQAVFDYANVMLSSGNKVTTIVNPSDPFVKRLEDIGSNVIKSEKFGQLKLWNITNFIYFNKLVKELNPDVIIAHGSRAAQLMKYIVRNKIPVIDVNHGRGPRPSRRTYATIVINKKRLSEYRDFFGKKHAAYNVPIAINLKEQIPPSLPKAWNDTPIIGTLGRLVKEKAIDVFIEALAILDKRGVKFIAKLGGDGELKNDIINQIKCNNLEDKVILAGWIKNPDEFYETIDIFCFPSRKEEFGLVLLEAYKHGLPVVVSDADGPADIVEHNKDALLVPKENAAALADALQELLQNKEKADNLAKAGYEKLVSKYSVPVVAKQLDNVLQEVINKKVCA
ncbi:MAG: glycosyltransferase [Rickettsiaceae bacterium]|jgi:glycosyltransferase involved in cell wall biosynthesis|nr:glycosyltransferase [Rickettsiaceae bacterium]